MRYLYAQTAAVKFMSITSAHSVLSIALVIELDEGECTRAAASELDVNITDASIAIKQFLQFCAADVVWQVTNKDTAHDFAME